MLIRKEKIEEQEDNDYKEKDECLYRSRELTVECDNDKRIHERVIVEACDFDWIFIKDNAA